MMELVSVVVVSYNSEKTIVETLESIYIQTYQNIELIISDDASRDNTCEIVREWIQEKGSRFVNVVTNFSSVNHGVSGNCNSGIKMSQGQWIKIIAADDILLENCIEDNLKYVRKNQTYIVFSNMHYMKKGDFDVIEEGRVRDIQLNFANKSVEEQFNVLLRGNVLSAPTAFIKRELFDKVGGFDESIPMMEDWPYWLKLTRQGYHIHVMDKWTVNYRVGEETISRNSNFYKVQQQVKEKYCYPYISKVHFMYYYKEKWSYLRCKLLEKVGENEKKYNKVDWLSGILWPPYIIYKMKYKK